MRASCNQVSCKAPYKAQWECCTRESEIDAGMWPGTEQPGAVPIDEHERYNPSSMVHSCSHEQRIEVS